MKEISDLSTKWNGYYVAEVEGEIVGAIGGGMTNSKTAEIYVLYLHPEKRNKKIGTQLLEAYTRLQQEEYNATEQWVSVEKENDKGIPFYKAKGFVFVKEEPANDSELSSADHFFKIKKSIRLKENFRFLGASRLVVHLKVFKHCFLKPFHC